VHGFHPGEIMPHKCVKCGREYPNASSEMVNGCESCGGKKFLYIRDEDRNRDVIEEKSIESIAKENHEEVIEIKKDTSSPDDVFNRVESIRIVEPGTYELNIEKLAKSDERVVGLGKDGSYAVDLLSMMRPRKHKKPEK
jgi:predicted  nucleic acid-binding Zn-ribbon protein